MRRKWFKFMGGVILMAGIISGCDNQDTIGEEEILGYLENFTSLHPTEHLMDFFDKEGVRDEHFQTSDKGVWHLYTSIAESQGEVRYTEGMSLRINRNTNHAEGFFFKNQSSGTESIEEERYPVVYDEDGFHLIEDIDDPVLEEKILNFRFVVQYMTLNEEYLSTLELPEVVYNPNRPLYHLRYELSKEDTNIQRILEQYSDYAIELTKKPRIFFRGNGNYDGGTLSHRSVDILFGEERNVRVSSSINYNPERGDE